jgi:hypothetical protein
MIGGMAQVEEHLPSKSKALSSTPSTAKNNKKPMDFDGILLMRKGQPSYRIPAGNW